MAEPNPPPDAPTSFEDAIRRLGEIVQRLEDGELTLEQSLQAFERGIALARDAQRRLDAAETRVDELLGVDEQGRAVTRPIGESRGSDPNAQRASTPSPDARPRAPSPAAAPPKRAPAAPSGDDDDLPF